MSRPTVYIDGQAGTTGLQIYDRLRGREDLALLTIDPDRRKDPDARRAMMQEADLTFFCLPDAAAREAAALAEGTGTRIIDASTAHRVSEGWVYGLPELHGRREQIKRAERVANPGCYATGAIALLRPLTDAGLLAGDADVTIHALSGYTGGGNKAIAQYEAPDREAELDSPRHYALGLAHKHIPEMMKEGGLEKAPIFCPIICDFPQGMAVCLPLHDVSPQAVEACYRAYYQGEKLITVRPLPESGFLGANDRSGKDDLELFVSGKEGQTLAIARLDNLGKGAAGAAVQNMNIMLGFSEYTALAL